MNPDLEQEEAGPSAREALLEDEEQDEEYTLEEPDHVDHLHVTESYILDENDPQPSDLSEADDADYLDDGDSELGDGELMDAVATEPLEPPDEDHSVAQLTAHTEPVFAVAINTAQPEMFASGGGDDVAYLWRLGQAEPACKLLGHTDTVGAMGFSADGALLATGGLDGSVRVWHAATGALAAELEGPTQGINWLAWHGRGQVLLAGSEDATTWMWKLPEGSVMQIFSAHSASVSYGCFCQGRSVVTASEDGTVRVWNPRAGTVDHCIYAAGNPQDEALPVTCLAPHPAQPIFMFGAAGALKVVHAETGRLLAHLPGHEASVESVGFCEVMQLAASAGMDGNVCIWDLGTLTARHSCAHGGGVVELHWLKESPMLLTCTVTRELRLWDGRSGACLQTLTGHLEAVLCMAVGYTAQGVYVLSGSDDTTARVWQPRLEPAA